MITLRDRCSSEQYGFAKNNFIDDFNANPSFDMISESILDISTLTIVQKALFAATVDELCGKYHVERPSWIFDSSVYLDAPYFAMNAMGDLRVILLQESPKWYRSRNLFVTNNCSERV